MHISHYSPFLRVHKCAQNNGGVSKIRSVRASLKEDECNTTAKHTSCTSLHQEDLSLLFSFPFSFPFSLSLSFSSFSFSFIVCCLFSSPYDAIACPSPLFSDDFCRLSLFAILNPLSLSDLVRCGFNNDAEDGKEEDDDDESDDIASDDADDADDEKEEE